MWTKISSLKIDLKMMVKSGLEFLILKLIKPFRVAAAQKDWIGLAGTSEAHLAWADFEIKVKRIVHSIVHFD